jgi:hypothetical protein
MPSKLKEILTAYFVSEPFLKQGTNQEICVNIIFLQKIQTCGSN